jgi:hypothetical protein
MVINVFNIKINFVFMADDDFEIGDVENFGGAKDEQFSHSSLVMSAMKRCAESASHELRPGWFNTKTDRVGNTIRTYIEDTRKVFIESVKSCLMVMACDLDKEAEDYINDCLMDIENKKAELIKDNDNSWNSLSPENKIKNIKQTGIKHIPGHLTHPALLEELQAYELEMYRSVFAELSRLTKRLDFYKAEMFIA